MATKLTAAEKWLRDIAAREAQRWYAMQCQDIHGQFYKKCARKPRNLIPGMKAQP